MQGRVGRRWGEFEGHEFAEPFHPPGNRMRIGPELKASDFSLGRRRTGNSGKIGTLCIALASRNAMLESAQATTVHHCTEYHLPKYQFASDNCSGICPEAWEHWRWPIRIARPLTATIAGPPRHRTHSRVVRDRLRGVLHLQRHGRELAGALAHLCQSYHSVICHERSHVETDECGGPGVLLQRHEAAAGRWCRTAAVTPAAVEETVQATDRHPLSQAERAVAHASDGIGHGLSKPDELDMPR